MSSASLTAAARSKRLPLAPTQYRDVNMYVVTAIILPPYDAQANDHADSALRIPIMVAQFLTRGNLVESPLR